MRLKFETAQITIALPSCIATGRELDLSITSTLTSDELQRVLGTGLSKLRASAGTISADLSTYTAPDREHELRLSVTLPKIDGTTTEIQFKPIEVSDSCTPPLVGNMVVTFDGELRDYWHSFGLTSHGSTHWKAVLAIKTGAPVDEPYQIYDIVYPDDGSTFQFSGSSEFVSCNRSEPGTCDHSTTETYHGSGPIAVGRGDLEIVADDGKVWLMASLPVTTDMNNRGSFAYSESIPTRWNIGCILEHPWWHFAGGQHAMFIQGGRSAPLYGKWTDFSQEEIEFDCNETWGVTDPDTREEYSATMRIQGRVRIKPQ